MPARQTSSGFYLPVHVFPEWLQTVADAGEGGSPVRAVPAKLGPGELNVGMHSRKTLDLG